MLYMQTLYSGGSFLLTSLFESTSILSCIKHKLFRLGLNCGTFDGTEIIETFTDKVNFNHFIHLIHKK